jgi:hypothetical protein
VTSSRGVYTLWPTLWLRGQNKTWQPVPAQDVARRIRRAWLARFTFNGIARYDQGAYGLVGGVAEGFSAAVELSDAEPTAK